MVPSRVPNPILDIYKRMGGTVNVAAELGLIDIAGMFVIFIKLMSMSSFLMTSNYFYMTFNNVPLIFPFRMTFRMTSSFYFIL